MAIIKNFVNWKQRPIRQKLLSIVNRLHKIGYVLHAKYHSLDFEGYITNDKLEGFPNSAPFATAYQGFSSFYLKVLIREALSTGQEFENFIDIGSGKGKVCICAAKSFKFKKIIGIDFSQALVDIANRNLAKLSYANIQFINADAIEWKIPDGNALIFLFNPFNASILAHFISSNVGHFKNNHSFIIYADAIHDKVIEELGFDKVVESRVYNSAIFKFKPIPPQNHHCTID
jgi:16S rRNA G966 N2-methylase RsmD